MDLQPTTSRTCTHCHVAQPPTAFSGRQSWCKPCVAAQVREYRTRSALYRERERQRHRAYYEALIDWWRAVTRPLLAQGCVRCGALPPAKLDFHHRDPATKLWDPSQVWSVPAPRRANILAELAKCEVLCNGCHRRTHIAMKSVAQRA